MDARTNPRPRIRPRELVLVGGGHTHVQVLRSFAMDPPPDTRLTLVVDTPIAVYSGMVPGFAAGQYREEELEIDVLPLARQAGARVIMSAATGVDPRAKRITLEGRPAIPYDLASFDIGSTVAGLELPGIREHAIPTRPIRLFVQRFEEIRERARRHRDEEPFRVLVVGGGAGGVEVAFAAQHRLSADLGKAARVLLLQAGPHLLPGYPSNLRRRVEQAAKKAGIEVRCGTRVAAAEADAAALESGERLPCNALLWVAGAISQPLFRDSGLATDDRGFVLVRPTLQTRQHEDLFAVGDCATLEAYPQTAKAGVYAVRQGPFLTANLRAALADKPPKPYRPQKDFLTLLNLADGTAIGGKWGQSFEGSWVMDLKDRIDRRFMRRFQVLERSGALTESFRSETMEMEGPMLCGGCAAKVGQTTLQRALARLPKAPPDPSVELGLEAPDDAAAVRTPRGERLVTTIDAFRAFTDDPYLVGRIAAVNAASDLLAKGVRPTHALALVALPETEAEATAEETLFQVLAGARVAFDSLGTTLLGGHTTTSPGLIVGFSIDGFAEPNQALPRLDGLRDGQILVLTKPLGTGVLFHADMQARARGPWIEAALESMMRPNVTAAEAARRAAAKAVTDITGFGLAGHLGEMLRQSQVAARVEIAALPSLPGARELLAQGLRSTFHPENARARKGLHIEPAASRHPKLELLFDPQTSGGLLIAVEPTHEKALLAELHAAGDTEAITIGRVVPARDDGAPIEVV